MKMTAKLIKATALVLAAQACSASPTCSAEDGTCASARQGIQAEPESSVQLLQTGATRKAEAKLVQQQQEQQEQEKEQQQKAEEEQQGKKKDELVLVHIPFNFGHTVEKVALFGSGADTTGQYRLVLDEFSVPTMSIQQRQNTIERIKRPNSQVWGHMNPDLAAISKTTGCPLYYTPQKYWPADVAEAYFGNKTTFGILRDPYERMVSIFRGNYVGYGGYRPEFRATCDVNGAVQAMMLDYQKGNKYAHGCTFVPQAEYFDDPHGITITVDNRLFPESMNEVFDAHGYHYMDISEPDILHVEGCQDVWAGDLTCETKALIHKVYKADFDLLCEKFGYCTEENTCIKGVPRMCPKDLASKQKNATHCS